MPELSDEERARRRHEVEVAQVNIELSGGRLSPEVQALSGRYIAGLLSSEAFTEALLAHARSLPASEPQQEYFTSLEDAMKAGDR